MAERLSDDDLISILRKEEAASENEQSSTLSEIREQSLKYYDREPYGDEQEGSSRVVTSEFADAIESIMPGMMEVFTGTDQVVEFMPSAPGEEKMAQEATDYVAHCFMVENDGFRLLHTMIKDCLMGRVGAMSVDLEEKEKKRTKAVQGLTDDTIDILKAEAAQQGAEIVLELTPDAQTATDINPDTGEPLPVIKTSSGTITVTTKREYVCCESIAPEDIRYTPTARTQDDASFQGYIKRTTASELIKLGLSQDDVDDLRSDRSNVTFEEEQRQDGSIESEPRDNVGDSERPLWLVVGYLKADRNGDGLSEMLKVVYAHSGGMAGKFVQEPEEWTDGDAPIVLASPILMPHTIVGRSLFDQTQDLQLISSVLTRGMLDNLYASNRPRPAVSDSVILDSLLDWVPGSPIRFKAGAKPGDGHIDWQKVPSVMGDALTALEYIQTVKENRTGTSRHNQGLDADSLNKTKGGMQMLMSAAQQRQKLMARVIAETAVVRLYRLVYRALKRAATGPTSYWTGKSFKTADPSKWPDDMDLTVNVGMGTGNTQQELEHLSFVAQIQEKLVALQGNQASGPWVTAENLANTAQKIAEKLGFKSPGMFFQPPEKVAEMEAAKAGQPPQPPPEVMIEQAKAQAEIEKQKAQLANDLEKIDAERQKNSEKHAMDMQLEQLKLDGMRMKMGFDVQTMELKAAGDAQARDHEHRMDQAKTAADSRNQYHDRSMARIKASEKSEEGAIDAAADGPDAGADGQDPGKNLADALKESIAAQRESAEAQREIALASTTATQQMALAVQQLAEAHMSDTELVRGPDGKASGTRKVPRRLN